MIQIPFHGSKRGAVKDVERIVREYGYKRVFEPFGGSAVISVNLYNDKLVDMAYINDYDHLFDIYPEYLDIKDRLVKSCFDIGMVKGKRRQPSDKVEFLQEQFKNIDEKYYGLLANNFVFGGHITDKYTLKDFCYFQNDLSTDRQREYLNIVSRLERSTLDYHDFYKKYQDAFDSKSLIILDPPYLNSYQKQYKNKEFFGLADTIEMLEETKKTGCDFLYFNMIERDTKKLLGLLDFHIEEFTVEHRNVSHNATREDVMALILQ